MIHSVFKIIAHVIYIEFVRQTHTQYVQIWSDTMDQNNTWIASSSALVSFGYASYGCHSNLCTKMYGSLGTDAYIYRSTNVAAYSSLQLQFDVSTDDLERNDSCSVYYAYDSQYDKTLIKTFDAPDIERHFYNDQIIHLPSAISANTLWIWFEATTGDSSSSDRCYWDNVYLSGILITPDPTLHPTQIPTVSPTSRPSSESGNIIIQNHRETRQWWVAFYLLNVDSTCAGYVSDVAITDDDHYKNKWIHSDDTSNQQEVYSFSHQGVAFALPITVRITRYNQIVNETLIAYQAITSFVAASEFDFGFNFCDEAEITPDTTALHSADSNTRQPSEPLFYAFIMESMNRYTAVMIICILILFCCINICWIAICVWCCLRTRCMNRKKTEKTAPKQISTQLNHKHKGIVGEVEVEMPDLPTQLSQLPDLPTPQSIYDEEKKLKLDLRSMDSGMSEGMYENQGENANDTPGTYYGHLVATIAPCIDCAEVREGKIYDGDGQFYCNECWQQYAE